MYEEIGDLETTIRTTVPSRMAKPARNDPQYEDVLPAGAKARDPYKITQCTAYGLFLPNN